MHERKCSMFNEAFQSLQERFGVSFINESLAFKFILGIKLKFLSSFG